MPRVYHRRPPSELFWKHVSPEPNTGCWLWLGHVMPSGYGKHGYRRTCYQAHRAAYEIFVGPIPPGLTIDHKCKVRCCVNPRHLRPATQKQQMETATKRKPDKVCRRGHELTDYNAFFSGTQTGRPRRRCRMCHNTNQNKLRYHQRRARGLIRPGSPGTGPKPHPQLAAMKAKEAAIALLEEPHREMVARGDLTR